MLLFTLRVHALMFLFARFHDGSRAGVLAAGSIAVRSPPRLAGTERLIGLPVCTADSTQNVVRGA